MKKRFKKLLKNWKVLFCYALIGGGILFTLAIFIVRPMKINTAYSYEYSNKLTLEKVNFPVIQHIRFNEDKLKALNIYFRDDSIKDYTYRVKLLDDNGKEYFNYEIANRDSDMVALALDGISLEKNYDYLLRIECADCSNVEMSVKEASDEYTYVEGYDDKSLEVTINYFSENNGFFWYSAMAIVIGLTLLPVARGNRYEKD